MADNFTLCLEKMHFEISVLRCQFIRRFKRTCSWPHKNSCSQVTTSLFLRLSLNWLKGGRIYVFLILQFSSFQLLSRVRLFATQWIAARQACLSITNSRSSLTHVHQVSDAIQPSHPLSSPSPPAPIPPSIRVFSTESTLRIKVAKVREFQL